MTTRTTNAESAARKADHEFFPTPGWATDAILSRVYPPSYLPSAVDVFDPCVGEGAILDRVIARAVLLDEVKPVCQGMEIDPGRAAVAGARWTVTTGDALTRTWPRAKLILFNPPFSMAQAFAEKALEEKEEGCTVAMLARLAFLESRERFAFHQKHPSDVYPLASRPGFLSSSGKTDMSAYAWFVWGPGRGNRWFLLPPKAETPKKTRAKRGGAST